MLDLLTHEYRDGADMSSTPPPFTTVCGVDLVDLGHLAQLVEHGGERFLHRVFTAQELAHCKQSLEKLATRIAAKEAVSKALGTGIRGVGWLDIEVQSNEFGKPEVCLHGEAKHRAQQMNIQSWSLSLSHEGSYAIAFTIATIFINDGGGRA